MEWIAVALAVTEVILAQQHKIGLYPAGIAATTISVFIFFEAGLYAESLLNCYYIVMSIYGWWYWIKKKNKPRVNITYSNAREWKVVIIHRGVRIRNSIFCIKIFHALNSAFCRCLDNRNRMGRNVAARKTKDRELDTAQYL